MKPAGSWKNCWRYLKWAAWIGLPRFAIFSPLWRWVVACLFNLSFSLACFLFSVGSFSSCQIRIWDGWIGSSKVTTVLYRHTSLRITSNFQLPWVPLNLEAELPLGDKLKNTETKAFGREWWYMMLVALRRLQKMNLASHSSPHFFFFPHSLKMQIIVNLAARGRVGEWTEESVKQSHFWL